MTEVKGTGRRRTQVPSNLRKRIDIGAKGRSWRSKVVETTIYHMNIKRNIISLAQIQAAANKPHA